jgi:hypothetical protein
MDLSNCWQFLERVAARSGEFDKTGYSWQVSFF